MKGKLRLPRFKTGDLIVTNRWPNVPRPGQNLIGVVMESEEHVVGRDYINDPIIEFGYWVIFPTATHPDLRDRWHWLEHWRVERLSKA